MFMLCRAVQVIVMRESPYHPSDVRFASPLFTQCWRPGWVQSLGQKIPWRREWLPTSVFLPGEFHGQRSLVDQSMGFKESDTTERLITRLYTGTLSEKRKALYNTSDKEIKLSTESREEIAQLPWVKIGQVSGERHQVRRVVARLKIKVL